MCPRSEVNFSKERVSVRIRSQVHVITGSESTDSSDLSFISGFLNKNFSQVSSYTLLRSEDIDLQ